MPSRIPFASLVALAVLAAATAIQQTGLVRIFRPEPQLTGADRSANVPMPAPESITDPFSGPGMQSTLADAPSQGLRLSATLVSSEPGKSRAMIEGGTAGTRAYSVGDAVTPQLVLAEVGDDHVRLAYASDPHAAPLTLYITYAGPGAARPPTEWRSLWPAATSAAQPANNADPRRPFPAREMTGVFADTPERRARRQARREWIESQAPEPAETPETR